ncbi:MAG TPA: carboxypeptidase regulatory-like domain-containing protein [Syntrophobacteraceae bacterium]|nr:carboxypeptidase regulatory-like domain-containing protein [Syntrophobacteraceae bacterium]
MPSSTGFVTGIVTDALSGAPLEGVTLTIDDEAVSVSSGPRGQYLLAGAAGNHTLVARKSGYKRYAGKITLLSGVTKTRNVSMAPA